MIKLKDMLGEDFGGSYGGNKNRRWSTPSYSRGEWVDNPNDAKGGSPIVVTAWDDIVDEYNGKHGYSTSTKSDSRVYESEIGNLSVGMEWKVSFRNSEWRYQLYKLGQLANIFRNLDELISHFKDNNGGNNVTESVITEEENMRRFGTKNLQEADASVAAPQIAKNNSCWDARKYPIIAGYINNKSIDLTGLIKVVILAVTSNSPLQSILVKQYTFLNSSDQQTLNGVLSEVKLFAKCITTNYAQMLAI